MLAKGNIRKMKMQMSILFVLFIVAAMLLNIGLTLLLGFGSHFDNLTKELNASDSQFTFSKVMWTPEIENIFDYYATEFYTHDGLLIISDIPWNDETTNRSIVFMDTNEERFLTQWKLVGESIPKAENGVYVPFVFSLNGYSLGDTFYVEGQDEIFSFVVSGFFEDIYSASMTALTAMIVPTARFNEMRSTGSDENIVVVFANGIENIDEILFTIGEIHFELIQETVLIGNSGTSLIQTTANRTATASMMSVMMIFVTIVITIVSLLVIRFRIKNSIEEDMPKIGSLQAIGYTGRQIVGATIVQYGSIALISSVVSILPAYFIIPLISSVFAAQGGIYWNPGFVPSINLLSILVLFIIVVLSSKFASRSIKKITPVVALRGGAKTHSFKRNPFKLDKSRLPLTVALSLKTVFQGIRQTIMMFVILLTVSFTAIVALVLFYNSTINLTMFELVPGIERSNVGVFFNSDEDFNTLQNMVLDHEDVRAAQFSDVEMIAIADTFTRAVTMDDYDLRVNRNVFRGIFPRYNNEVAISGVLADQLGLEIGDEVIIGRGQLPYIVTGFSQGMEAGSPFMIYLTNDGMRRTNTDFEPLQLLVYLYPGADAAKVIDDFENSFGESIMFIGNLDAIFAENVGVFASIMSMIGIGILAVSAFVVLLVLYFVISSSIIRNHKDFGTQKAIGYTTKNLMNQISITFFFPIFFGVTIGAVIATVFINPMMSVGMASMGVMQSNMLINVPWIVATGVILIVFAYLMSLLITWRIRKISAYKLVTE